MELEHERQMLNVCANGKYEQRELDHVQVMPRGQMSRYVPKLREGEQVHYTVGGGIVIVQHQTTDRNLVVELIADPSGPNGMPVFKIGYADGRTVEVSQETFEFHREEMEARFAKYP